MGACQHFYRNTFNLLMVISWLKLGANCAQTDKTLDRQVSGVNVVIAVLEKIDVSRIFNESEWFNDKGTKNLVKLFLRYKAYVESKDGTEAQGRIWTVTEEQLNETKSYVNNTHLGGRIKDSALLGIDWPSINYTELSIPIYCGLANMLLLDKLLRMGTVTVLTENRFPYLWVEYFSGNNRHEWQREVTHLKNHQSCYIKSDIVFVLDASNSISVADLEEAKSMVYNFTDQLDTSDGDNRIGIVLIQTTANVYLELGDGLTPANKNETLRKIEEIPYIPYHLTNTADGLCKMSKQPWRNNDSSVLQVAIVLTDGKSNHDHSEECEGGIKKVASYVHSNHSHILVFAVGIGNRISTDELLLIASKDHLVTRLGQYDELDMMEGSLQYEICYTLPATVNEGEEAHGRVKKDQIVRWILQGVDGDGVTIRLCITEGRLSLYVSQEVPLNPSEVIHDNQATIGITNKLAIINCTTIYNEARHVNFATRKRRQLRELQNLTTTIYISIVGGDDNTIFSMNSESGNVTFDVNECEQEPFPCAESAMCYNTDGSFYCECQEGFSGDGFECTGLILDIVDIVHIQIHEDNQLAVILPSALLSMVIIVLLMIVIVLVFLTRSQKCESSKESTSNSEAIRTTPKMYISEIQLVRANLRKVSKTVSATNPLSMRNSAHELDVKEY